MCSEHLLYKKLYDMSQKKKNVPEGVKWAKKILSKNLAWPSTAVS